MTVYLKPAKSTEKPEHHFYAFYGELCRRANAVPLASVKPAKPKKDTVLDFTVDRIKFDEWTPILKAIRLDTSLHVISIRSRTSGCKFLEEIDTEEKVRQLKRKAGSLWTDYVFKIFMSSINNCLKNSSVLSTLELEGLPLSKEYMQAFLETLKNNKSINIMSLRRCHIGDSACNSFCENICDVTNIETLNLSGCSLSCVSGQHIAKLIKHQQTHRYNESWHNSLRYKNPNPDSMAGLKRISINDNPCLGDIGIASILKALEDDYWIKAIDMQRCGITDKIGSQIVDVIKTNKTLVIADFRFNNKLSVDTINETLKIIEERNPHGSSKYAWCSAETMSNDLPSFRSSQSSFSIPSHVRKTKSAPINRQDSTQVYPIRKSKTSPRMDRKGNVSFKSLEELNLQQSKMKINQMQMKLQEETFKRKEVEKKNRQLEEQLSNINKIGQEAINSKLCLTNLPSHFIEKEANSSKISLNRKGSKQIKKRSKKKSKSKVRCLQTPSKHLLSDSPETKAQNLFEDVFTSKVKQKQAELRDAGDTTGSLFQSYLQGNSGNCTDTSFESKSTSSLETFMDAQVNRQHRKIRPKTSKKPERRKQVR